MKQNSKNSPCHLSLNRRDFLKSLISAGFGITLPDIGDAEQDQVDRCFEELLDEPKVFLVSEYKTIYTDMPFDYNAKNRKEFHNLPNPFPDNRKGILELMEHESLISTECENYFDDLDLDRNWQSHETWLKGCRRSEFKELLSYLNSWADDELNDSDYEYALLRGDTPQGDALRFFESEDELRELLNIKIIYGDHPGSSYYAAELHDSIEVANKLLKSKEIPIIFENGEPSY